MTLVLIEGFDNLNALADKYTIVGNAILDSITKRNGSQSCKLPQYTDKIKISLSAEDTYIIGFGIYVDSLSAVSGSGPQINFKRNSSSNCSICIDGSGYFRVYRSITLLQTSSKVISLDTWHHLEIKATCKNSIGANEFVIKLDGEVILNVPTSTDTQNTATSGIDEIELAGIYTIGTIYIDDLFICDINGSLNNDFIGDCKVETLYPNGNGNSNQFTGSDADSVDNYLLVDEAQQNADTDYTEDSVVNNLDLYTFDDLSVTPDTVMGLCTRAQVKKSDAGSRTGKLQCRRSSTNYEGSEFFPATDYGCFEYILEQDPSTTAEWTESGINAAEFGIKVHT